jgi:allophanate hydrolase subunit 2
MPTEPVAPGAVQIPPDGRPILLGPECGTLGGYPTAAWVITADLPRLAQLVPGDPVRFAAINMEEARWLLAGQRALLDGT